MVLVHVGGAVIMGVSDVRPVPVHDLAALGGVPSVYRVLILVEFVLFGLFFYASANRPRAKEP